MSDCGCCDGIEIVTPVTECNPPGLTSIAYRAGTYATFYETMLARLSNTFLDIPSVNGTGTDRLYPLRALTARDTTDPSIALLDAWAVICDVLTFYQERIANEGYLPTAIERRSILELARLVGYRMRPGVAASVYLAFTASQGFTGDFPAGTRAQSIPGSGQMPQFFETSDALEMRDVWNAMKPRLTRPQLISPPTASATAVPGVTDSNVIDTLYFDGLATNLKSGDSLILLSGGTPILRQIETITMQATEQRTEAVLAPYKDEALQDSKEPLIQAMGDFLAMIDKATYLFPNNAIAGDVGGILNDFSAKVLAATDVASTKLLGATKTPRPTVALTRSLAKLAYAQIRERQAVADGRGFTRLSAWIDHVQVALAVVANITPAAFADACKRLKRDQPASGFGYASSQQISPLGNLVALSQTLALPPSLQPRNAIALKRSVKALFAPQSDMAAKMVKAFRPAYAAQKMYGAWDSVAGFGDTTEIFAIRARAALFANRDPGPVTIVTGKPPEYDAPPTIFTAWKPYVSLGTAPQKVLLDAAYDQIALATIVAIDRPAVNGKGFPTGPRVLSFHTVTGKQTSMMSTGDGFQGNITFLSLDPPWLDGLTDDQINAVIQSRAVLTDTTVYAQSEALALAEEPLDTDVAGDTISLDGVYDGLEPGRWVIVSGNRTDVTNVTDVAASELAMIGGVLQGAESPLSIAFPSAAIPLAQFSYVTAANDKGERLVVGTVADLPTLKAFLTTLDPPQVTGQQFTDQVELAPGYYANALVPTAAEHKGLFHDFAGALINPDTSLPFANGEIPMTGGTTGQSVGTQYYAWRISAQKTHTILKLANSLAYTYDTASVSVYGNVAKATQGQTTGEILGDGDAGKRFQTFALRQSPLTYISAPTAEGATSTLTVTVNEIEWHEQGDLTEEGPRDRSFITSTDDDDTTSIIFGDGTHGARVPTGTANVKATYRFGIGAAGNVDANQISQLASHPLGAQGVINPLPASGGADRDTADMGRRNAPLAVMALDRLVSVKDYADFSRTYAGIGKAAAAQLSDGFKTVVYVTVAGAGDIPIDVNSDLYNNLLQSLSTYGDPYQPVQIGVRKVRLLVVSMNVALLPDYQWDAVEPVIRAAVLALFGFDARDLGQPAFLSEVVRAVQEIEGVSYCDPQVFDSVGEDVTAQELAGLAGSLRVRHAIGAAPAQPDPSATDPGLRIKPAELVFLTPDIADTLVLTQIGA
jgi:hypothetical protein